MAHAQLELLEDELLDSSERDAQDELQAEQKELCKLQAESCSAAV